MSNLYLYNEKATVCSGKNCITVYGKAAKWISALVVAVAFFILINLIIKMLS